MLTEWAYARPYTSEAQRAAAFPDFLHHYNHHRGHSTIGYRTPAQAWAQRTTPAEHTVAA